MDQISDMRFEDRSISIPTDEMAAKLWGVDVITAGDTQLFGRQLTNSYAIVALLSGGGTLERDGRTCRLRPDTVYPCMPETTFGITPEEGDSAIAVVRFGLYRTDSRFAGETYAAEAGAVTALFLNRDTAIEPHGRVADLCRAMRDGMGSGDALLRWKAQIGLYELLYETMAASGRQRTAGTGEALERARRYMEEHCGEPLNIERLAGIAELSPKYFVDLFKKTYGRSALDFLTHIRMAKAKRLMLRSDRRLKDIAHEVGYEDEFYFSRKFKKESGLSPTAFRKRRERKIALYGSSSLLGYMLPLHIIPHAAPLHPKWSEDYYNLLGADIPFHLDGYRQNYRKSENLDRLAESRPHLIVTAPGLEIWEKERLDAIAEHIEMPEEPAGWRQGLLLLAERLGETAEAERWIGEYERRTAELKARAESSLQREPVLFVRVLKGRLYAYCNQGIEDVVYGDLAVIRPEGLPARGTFNEPLSLEKLERLGTGRVLVLVCQESETLDAWKRLSASPEWLSLSAVRNRKLQLIGSNPWREHSPVAAEKIRDEAIALLAGNCP
ncbi:helix-turn-helix domain-containing protein [Paenibacillus thailandensis]|uniref:Helix-turn-helix domain-containing protein n=1 Tax=Paenibacillus thailandensis TaxID=393250 RepID=A0ABW5QW23_9BACL